MSLLKSAAIAVAGFLMTAAAYATPEIGKPAPHFSAVDSNGKSVKLSDYRGKVVLLDFWSYV